MNKKRIISAVLAICIMITVFPMELFAVEDVERTNPFSDIKNKDWFYEDALYAYENNLFSGTSANTFSPNNPMTRAMYVTVIGRMAKIDTSLYTQSSTFMDVVKGNYYAPYVEWAKQMGITSGTGNGTFSPDKLVTRQDMATFTARYFDAYGYTYPNAFNMTLPRDLAQISSYAKDSVLKLWSVGLLKGDENGNFNPLKSATRAETAAFFSRIHRSLNLDTVTSENNASANNSSGNNNSGSDSSGNYTVYEVQFETNGGGTISSRKIRAGQALDKLPIPFKENAIFQGWCYDKDLSLPIATTDTIKANITLYAKYLETKALTEFETPVFASSLDQGTDFTIKVISSQDMTAAQVKDGIIAKNLSSITQEDFISVKGSKRSFLISGENGFEEGATFKLSLDDENLSFEGFPESVRDYNFTIAKEKTLNFSFNEDIIYIPAGEIVSITGKANAPISLNEGGISETAPSGGSFTYSGSQELKAGDKLAIYEGTRPDLRTVENDNDGEILYVKIIGKSGNSYEYTGVDVEEVLFTPDVLPISKDSDLDGDPNNYSLRLSQDSLDFSGDIYQNIGLNSQTTIDKGDFISFYDGDFGKDMEDLSYGEITSVIREGDIFLIEFKSITQEDMFASMDAYDTNQISGQEMLENVNKNAIEKSVEKQALDSGFAEEAGLYLASLALKTDSFTELSSEYDLTDIEITPIDGDDFSDGEIMLMEGAKVEVDISKIQATLGTELDYFDGYDGLRLTLEIGVEITIHASDKADIVIEITGRFEQEVRIDINVDGGAIWKWWGPFPYISEYEATANIDLFNYTGIGIEATIVTAEAGDDDLTGMDDETINDIGKQLKDLMDAKDKYVGDGSGTVAEGLADKYKSMIENENSEWVELFSEELFKKEFTICVIIAVEVGAEFVVSANVNISIGMDFYYANAKRYSYTIAVFANNVTSDVIDIVEEQYQFEFYVMGTMGIRAGVKAEIKVGLFTTTLASVGFTAEVGAYVRVWGYFYYQLRWTASQGKTTKYSGAMLFELGIYLEIAFEAQAFNGTFSYNPTLYDNEWPLWYAGMRENVQNFSYEEEEVPDLEMKKTIQTVDVPNDIFDMEYMDLKTGEIENKVFDDETNFNIEMSNEAFSYNTNTNMLTINPGEKQLQEGQMIITWITAPLAFTSAPIERRIDLHWDNYNDGYSIAFNSNGGSSVPMIIQRYGGSVTTHQAPVKEGYAFEGWYSDSSLKNKYSIPSVMPDKDTLVYAKWSPRTDTKYEIFHYKQDINNNYSLADIDTLSGTTDSKISPQTKTYTGFTSPELQELVINGDGSSKVNYYYKRNTYTVSFESGDESDERVTNKVKYGAVITAPSLTKEGYDFTGWNAPIAASMPSEDLTYTALWEPKGDVAYRVEHYVMQTDGRYKFKEFENRTGNSDEIIIASNLRKSSIEVENGITYSHATLKGINVEDVKVNADGSLVVKLYYKRLSHDITFKAQNWESDIQKTLKYDEPISLPDTPILEGYRFEGWYTDETLTLALDITMPAKDVIAYAKLTPNNNTPYRVEHYVMDTDGSYLSSPNDIDENFGKTDMLLTLSELASSEIEIEGGIEYSLAKIGNTNKTEASISGDGSLVVKLYYERKTYDLIWEMGEGQVSGDYTKGGKVYYGASITPPNISREGYSFVWDKEPLASMPANACTYTALWTANTNTPYKVEHYVMGTDGAYPDEPTRTDEKSGTTDTSLTLSDLKKSEILVEKGIEYSHAELADKTETESTISGDGSLVVELYYERKAYELTWVIGEREASGDYTEGGSVYYGASITAPSLSRAGYTYIWEKEPLASMPANACTYTALWTANTNTPYKVEHYVMVTDGDYPNKPTRTDEESGTTDMSLTLSDLKKSEILVANGIEYSHAEVQGKAETESIIYGDGSLVVELYYERKAYDLTWEIGEGRASGDYTQGGSVYYGTSITPPTLTRPGYTYVWDKTPVALMPNNNCIYEAVWTANIDTPYTVEHYQENAGYDYSLKDRDILKGTTDTRVYAEPRIYDYFKSNSLADDYLDNGYVIGDGSLLLKLFYDRDKFEVSFDPGDGSLGGEESQVLKHGETVSTIDPTRPGYGFGGWYLDERCSEDERFNGIMPTEDIVLYAKWVAGQVSYKVEHYVMDTSGSYPRTPNVTENKTEYADTVITVDELINGSLEVRNGIEFIEAEIEDDISTDATVSGDGSLVVKMYYERVKHRLTWDLDGGRSDNDYSQGYIYYGETIVIPQSPQKAGYTYEWLDREFATSMPTNDLNYALEWTPNSYTVIFNANDGSTAEEFQEFVYDEEEALIANTFVRRGYSFLGWAMEAGGEEQYSDGESVKNLTEGQDGQVSLYAVWSPIEYNISYVTDFEDVLNRSYTVEDRVTLPLLSHTGYVFDGWYDNGGFTGSSITELEANSIGDKLFYAKWTANSYTVSFNANDGTDNQVTQDFTYDEEEALKLNSFVRTGYTFSGWTTAESGEIQYSDGQSVKNLTAVQDGQVSFYAVWSPIEYTITYNRGFEGVESRTYTVKDAVTLPVLSHTGYVFDGWYDNGGFTGSSITELEANSIGDKSFYAKWTANSYTVSFNANDGTANQVAQDFIYDVEQVLRLNSFERTGYTFSGWTTAANGERQYSDGESVKNLTAVKDGQITLYSVWAPISYTITYNTAFESVVNMNYTAKDTVTLPVLSHTGYTFGGWYDNGEFTGSVYTNIVENTTGDKAFYAKWIENTYTIVFNSNGGTGAMSPQEFAYTEEKVLSSNEFTRTGYTFIGWAKEIDGVKVYDDANSVQSLTSVARGNINIYAIWTLNTYKISYVLNGGMNSNNNPSQYDVTQGAITLEAPSRLGYTFGGWYVDEALATKASDPAILEGQAGDKVFYAKWVSNKYSVSFNPNGGSGTMGLQGFVYDEPVKSLSPNSFILNGYNFKGWNTKVDGSGVSYGDQGQVRNLTTTANGVVTLYAQWAPVSYSISYGLYGGVNVPGNPSNYTIETPTIVLKVPTNSTEGSVFAGWYKDSSFTNPITEIPVGSTGNIQVYAKWINSGKFTIVNNSNNSFTISRTGGKDKAQTVYYRTLNGSAIGGTHFTHQENSIVFGDGQVSATVTIAENAVTTMYGSNAATAYANADREYFVEIYNVVGGATLGDTLRAKRTMSANSSYLVSEATMMNYKNIASVTKSSGGQSGLEVFEDSGGGYNVTINMGLNSNALNTTAYGGLGSYISATADGMRAQLRNFKGTDDGWRMYRYVLFNTTSGNVSFSSSKNGSIPNLPTGTKAALVYGINTNTDNTDSYSVSLPGAKGSILSASGTSKEVKVIDASFASGQPSTNDYVLYGLNESIGISIGAYNSAAANSSWWFNSAELHTMPYDISGPDYYGLAPMSNTSYKLGSKVTIALVFDEIVKSADGVSVLTNLSNNAFTLAGGLGTNVLYFEGTVTNTSSAASVTTINNKANIKDIFGNSAK